MTGRDWGQLGWNWAGTGLALGGTGSVLVCTGVYWSVLVCTGVYWCAPTVVSIEDPFDQDNWEGLGGPGGNWAGTGLALGGTGLALVLYWSVLVCTGLYWCAPAVVSIEDPFDQDDWEGWEGLGSTGLELGWH